MNRTAALEAIVRTNPVVARLLERLRDRGVPSWYLGAGAVTQTVWNHLHGFAPTHAERLVAWSSAGRLRTGSGGRPIGIRRPAAGAVGVRHSGDGHGQATRTRAERVPR